MPWTVTPFEPVSNLFHCDPAIEPLRVHLFTRRHKDNVSILFLQQTQVAVWVTRIGTEIFGRAELGRVNENAHYHRGALSPSLFHQSQVPLVQVAHRGDKAY